MCAIDPLDTVHLPPGIRARFVDGVNGLRVHLLEAGSSERPLILLLHGFPELAYSWRNIMLPLAEAGHHVVAPDLRGYGRTTGWATGYDIDLTPFSLLNLVRDTLALVAAVGHRDVAMLVGHDFGSSAASACALVRPDIVRSVVLMSAPFAGTPEFAAAQSSAPTPDIHAALAALDPPRKHYHWYYATRAADADMHDAPQGLHDFLRAYYHHKSGDWLDNRPFPLAAWSASELAKLPTYYVMRQDQTMAQTVADAMPSPPEITACRWLPDAELRVYSSEYRRTGFQGGLNWYRARVDGLMARDLATFAGRIIDIPAAFIAGDRDWGVHQKAGDFEAMRTRACAHMWMCELIPGAGHWVQQEMPDAVTAALLAFLRNQRRG